MNGDDSMSKRVYISADYSNSNGDREVVELIHKWCNDKLHKIDFVDTASGPDSVSNDPNCRACDLKYEFNTRINLSSAVIFIIGDKTSTRLAGSKCERFKKNRWDCKCTPYKQNNGGTRECKVFHTVPATNGVGCINNYSYLQHEFEQAKIMEKNIIIFYNSSRNEYNWLPTYMNEYILDAQPFWIIKNGYRVPNYEFFKQKLGYY